MVQCVYRQIKQVDKEATVTIATSKTQVSPSTTSWGGSGHLRGTMPPRYLPAIALATAYLDDVQGVGLDEPVVVCPVDPYVENDYFEALKALCDRPPTGEANLVLMGIEPTYPSEKYGYIIPQRARAPSARVKTFKEKPDAEPRKGTLPRVRSGTAACLPTSCAMCWTRPMS